jgi:hypothetical protein
VISMKKIALSVCLSFLALFIFPPSTNGQECLGPEDVCINVAGFKTGDCCDGYYCTDLDPVSGQTYCGLAPPEAPPEGSIACETTDPVCPDDGVLSGFCLNPDYPSTSFCHDGYILDDLDCPTNADPDFSHACCVEYVPKEAGSCSHACCAVDDCQGVVPCMMGSCPEGLACCYSCQSDEGEYTCTTNTGEKGIKTAIGCIGGQTVGGFVSRVLAIGIAIAGGVAFLLMIIGTYQVLSSSGDPKKLQAGKELITAAVAGLLFIVFSIFILRVLGEDVLEIFGPDSPFNP